MSVRTRMQYDKHGLAEVLMSAGVAEQVDKAAEEIAKKASEQGGASKNRRKGAEPARYVVKGPKKGNYGGGRMIAYVSADNREAIRDAIFANRLERVIWGKK